MRVAGGRGAPCALKGMSDGSPGCPGCGVRPSPRSADRHSHHPADGLHGMRVKSGFGPCEERYTFFLEPDQSMQIEIVLPQIPIAHRSRGARPRSAGPAV